MFFFFLLSAPYIIERAEISTWLLPSNSCSGAFGMIKAADQGLPFKDALFLLPR